MRRFPREGTPGCLGNHGRRDSERASNMEFTYDLVIDPDADNNTHAYALELIGHNKRVLEMGCATGYFTKVLGERGCKVVGVEIDPEAAALAEQWAERVVVGDVDEEAPWETIDDESFDVVTFGDVLEHLRDPLATLRKAVTKLKPEGFIVASLPNVAHGDVRLTLLHGSFPYRDIGLLDRTHLRFFTLQSVRELLEQAGLVVVDTRRVIVPLFSTEFELQQEDYPETVVDEIRADAECETYQFVMKSVINNGSQAVADLANHLSDSTDQINQLKARNRLLESQLAKLSDRATAEYIKLQEEQTRLGEQIDAWAAHAKELNERNEANRVAAEAALQKSVATTERLGAALDATQRQYEQITNSTTYRLTAPVRRLSALVRSGRKA
jgi:2-polyprenyl-3-methyl-5-hydroxy-6-metoxy-1,4-benzoquinol methylase